MSAHIHADRREPRISAKTLVLMADDLPRGDKTLLDAATALGARHDPRFGILAIPVGEGATIPTPAALLDFLRAVVKPQYLHRLRAAWATSSDEAEYVSQMIYARPVLTLLEASPSSLLLEILENRRIETWFQPVLRAKTLGLWGYECLMRARGAAGELIGAPQILDWARDEHLLFMLDRVCQETHLENAGRLGAPPGTYFLVNFLPTVVYRPESCLQSSLDSVRRSGLTPSQIIFEVVESERLTDLEHLRRVLGSYRECGFGVALDDLGAGYSGLSLLADLTPDVIKIGRELVTRAPASDPHKLICEFLVRFGREHGRLVLAEGVETEDEHRVMERIGVDLLQGFLFARPAPAASFPAFSALSPESSISTPIIL